MEYTSTTHLILTCCHSIYLSGPTRGLSPDEWLLSPFQSSEQHTFISHAQAAISLLASSPPSSSLAIFSGGRTRPETQRSEAEGYVKLCEENGFWGLLGDGDDGRKRVFKEEKALDSMGNILLSLTLFWRTTKRWPEKITVVTHAFKRARFMDLHFPALRYPTHRVEFVGIDPEYMDPESKEYDAKRTEEVRRGEKEKGYKAWEDDMLGTGEVLRGKRMGRDFWQQADAGLFENEEERRTAGLESRWDESINGEGKKVREEVLVEGGRSPWEVE